MTSCCVTILIPTYARTPWLQEALWCAVNQTVPAQIIVLNDCPGQFLVCDHPLVKVVNLSEKIARLGQKRNELLYLAKTEWVVWLDDDDWLLPWYIEELTRTFSPKLDAVFTTRCWHACAGNSDGLVSWSHGSAKLPMAVRLKAAKSAGGFPTAIDAGEDRSFYLQLLSRFPACTLLKISGYCCRQDNGVFHTSRSGDPLSGFALGKDVESRLKIGLEPSGRIILSPSLRHDYFRNFPDKQPSGKLFELSKTHQPETLQKHLSFADQTIKIVYPSALEETVNCVFADFCQKQEQQESSTIVVSHDSRTGRYSILSAGMQDKAGIVYHDLGQQLLFYTNNVLLKKLSTGLAVHAGAIARGTKAILLPGTAGVGKSFLTAWFLSQSYKYLTDTLVNVRGENYQVKSQRQPLSIKKSGMQLLQEVLGLEQYSTDIIEGSTTSLVPMRLFPCSDEGAAEVSIGLLVFSEFRPKAELSVEALSPAQAALLLMASVANGPNLPGHGFPQVSRICKDVPALRLIYGDFKQLTNVLDRIITIILDFKLAPADFIALTAPFNRNRHLEELVSHSVKKTSTTSPPVARLQEESQSTAIFPVPEATPRGPQKKLTIGMATYDDFDGVYFSIQSLRMYHSEILSEIEILVVDNHPDGPCAEALKKLDTSVSGYRYVPEQGMTGTAVRDIIFREACGEFVLCMDCHVLIVPGALQKLMEYLGTRPECQDLLQGPRIYDDLVKVSTHFKPEWQAGMYGIWGTDERGFDSSSDPFDIPMQGLGLFCCRRDAWPGFNPRFRGFGGEEGYIHEKMRQNGGRTLCLPFLRWLHRFQRPMGIPYKNSWEDRIHNYLVGFEELGLDSQPIEDHFAEHLGEEAAKRICASIKKEIHSPFSFFDAIYCITMDTASERWKKMLPRLQALGIAGRVQVFKAVATPENYHIGYALSHRGIIAQAQRRQLKNVLVFEDDAVFLDDTLHHLAGNVTELKKQDWNIFYLGGHKWGKTFPYADGCSSLQRPRGLTSTHALAYNACVYAPLLAELPETIDKMALWVEQNRAIDQHLPKLDKLFVASPVLATQPALLPQEDLQYRSRFDNTQPASHKYEFSICAIFKNEARILKQWIDHHLLFGCQHFYLINNASNDGSETVLQPYIEKGLVDLVDEPRLYRQWFAYNEYFLELICRDTSWIGIIDIDEYLYPRNGSTDIKQVLRNYNGVDALAVPWLSFGSSDLIKQPENVIDSFIYRKDYDHTGGTSFKTIARTDALAQSYIDQQKSWDQGVLGIHSHRLKPGKIFLPSFLPNNIELEGGSLPYCYAFQESFINSAQLVINHYRTMSREYYLQVKMKRPSACTPLYDFSEGDMEYFNNNDNNDIKDETLKNLTRTHPDKLNR